MEKEKLPLLKDIEDWMYQWVVKFVGAEKDGQYWKFKTIKVLVNWKEYLHFINENDFDLGVNGKTLNFIKGKGKLVISKAQALQATQATLYNQAENTLNKDLLIVTQSIFKTIYDEDKDIKLQIETSFDCARFLINKVKNYAKN